MANFAICQSKRVAKRRYIMVIGQKVGYARVSTAAQDLSIQKERLSDCDRIFE